ncbi:sulfotransferase family protein [Nocardioidaceae bacterium SCSIO 66511]|nr:sulfotransferase family protein [Nocardioidaceae bacterium SCSIO 66511]
MPEPTHDAESRGRLVLITGTGRSGTSTVSGTLSHLGLHVPGPYLGANNSNPKGFFESRWAVKFHKRLYKRAWIDDFDGRPEAVELVREAITPRVREDLRTFLGEASAEHDQVVVKDPRTVWSQALWADCAAAAGLSIRYLSMLRHPAEVLGSRTEYYASGADADRRRYYAMCSLGRWVNSCIVNERETRGERRTFVRYVDLLADWRTAMKKVAGDLGIDYDSDLDDTSAHAVDEFIDPDLRRVQVTWDDVDVDGPLRDLAEDVWQVLGVLADSDGGDDADASEQLDELGARYAGLLRDAKAMSHDATEQSVKKAKDTAVRQERRRVREAATSPQAAPAAPNRSGVGRVRARARGVLGSVAAKVRSR